MAAHARLKNKFKEDEKYHNLMTWLKCFADFSERGKSVDHFLGCSISIKWTENAILFGHC